ncbi:hypothetical protein AK812_SmicGene8727 [Symbiodinium microadriaticum]|uniref:FHA domain-containing protein n=1 Tax=Symbiodinium microadriaticum TaxID=2951 RepID=A0A1Q9EK09_SYMMI|nr:hypothetical protein AK812_SmicGene8727 [Symbiodinium microadriaticum]
MLIEDRRYPAAKPARQAVVKEEYIDFVSRNHFAIAFEDQCFFLLALSQNRIWLDRGEASGTRSLQRDEMQVLEPGNRILLGTSEARPESPEASNHRGRLTPLGERETT